MGKRHECKMPRWRSRWKNRVYVCRCGRGWTARYGDRVKPGSGMSTPTKILDWYPVSITVGSEPVTHHG